MGNALGGAFEKNSAEVPDPAAPGDDDVRIRIKKVVRPDGSIAYVEKRRHRRPKPGEPLYVSFFFVSRRRHLLNLKFILLR